LPASKKKTDSLSPGALEGDLVLAADSAAFQLPGAANGGFCPLACQAKISKFWPLEVAKNGEKPEEIQIYNQHSGIMAYVLTMF
jgi:hypothetical protein